MASRLTSEHGMAGKVTSNCTFKEMGTPINKTDTNWTNQADYEREAALLVVFFRKNSELTIYARKDSSPEHNSFKNCNQTLQ